MWEELDDLRSASVDTALWSPLALPSGVGLTGSWEHRVRWSSCDYFMVLHVRSLPPPAPATAGGVGGMGGEDVDGKDGGGGESGGGSGGGCGGDGDGRRRRNDAPDGVSGFDNDRRLQVPALDPWQQLLLSTFKEAPSTGLGEEVDEVLSQTVDLSSATGINPMTVRLLRTWLYGSAAALPGVGDGVSDYALTSFAVTAGLSDAIHSPYRYAGPVWTCDDSDAAEMRADGVWVRVLSEEHLPPSASPYRVRRTWVDHAVRAASNGLTTLDSYYHRHDPAEEKRIWGHRALAEMRAAARDRGGGDDDDDDDNESDAPLPSAGDGDESEALWPNSWGGINAEDM